jgi:Hypothetical glycosyl hydrolase family 15
VSPAPDVVARPTRAAGVPKPYREVTIMSWPTTLALCLALVVAVSVTHAQRSETERARDAVAAAADLGESAPDWLTDSESYAIGYDPAGWEALAASKVAFITHCPVNREFFERCHALGIRCFPYVTFYQGCADRTYEDLNLKDHPEFIEVNAEGNLVRTGFWESEDAKNMYTTCPNVQGYQDAMVAWVRKIMELGADGVFVDNLSSRAPCFGPKFKKHEHLYEDQNHAFAMLLKRVRELIKQYKPEGAVLGNSASPLSLPREFWKYLDAEMLESYICTWVSTDRWFDWRTHWHESGVKLQPFVRAGKQIQCLSYLGHTPYGVREDGFFCYATARLAGLVWNGGLPLSSPDTAILYQIRLGRPLGDEQEENGVFFRAFERGFVAVNPDKEKPAQITVKAPIPTRIVDLAGGACKSWGSGPKSNDSLDMAVKHGGSRSIKMVNVKPDESILSQGVTLHQTEPRPIVASGWSKAENASGDPDGNYSVYLDILFTDGTPLFGQIAPFSTGTHDWEFEQVVVKPEKPIESLTVNVLFRYRTGTVWFDDISLKEGDDPAKGTELLKNGGFEEVGGAGRMIDVATTDGKLTVPAYSGRVYLYASDTRDELYTPGPRLTVATKPALGEVRFRIDGFDYWTHSGRWTTEYYLGPEFGRFDIVFDRPGKHTIEIVDIVPADMKTPAGYGSGERLGQFMDPSQPTKPSEGRKFHFREWTGPVASKEPRLEIDVSADTTVTAEFDVEQK